MASFTQSHRALAIATALDHDALLLEKLSGTEAISDLFRFRLDLLAPAPVDFGKVLNQWATLRIGLPNGTERYINGMIARMSQGGQVPAAGRGKLIRYSADLVPTLWRLGKRVRSRIFQNQSVPDILKHVLADNWRLELSMRLSGRYEPRNYCVQYAESDLAFVSRLMEEEGIAYYFTHTADEKHEHDQHTLVLTDNPAGFVEVPNIESIAYQAERRSIREPAHIWDWVKTQEVLAGLHSLSDYHFELPTSRLAAQATVLDRLDVGRASHPLLFPHRVDNVETLEVFDFPAGYAHRFDAIDGEGGARGKEIEKLHDDSRRVAKLSRRRRRRGACSARGPVPAPASCRATFSSWTVTSMPTTATCSPAWSTGQAWKGPTRRARTTPSRYTRTASRRCPRRIPFRPRRVTPKPRVDGLQTATVTGPKETPVYADPHGRVKVKFHWDREGVDGHHSSCWVRVSQPWAGPHYGAFFWPRPGHEVVVGFEHGDPDRPLITGSVYNADNPPPANPMSGGHLAGFKNASLGADPQTRYNSIVFDDRPNRELVQIHSETGAINTTEASHFHRSAASFEAYGRLVLTPGGSGSGSGGGGEKDPAFDPEKFLLPAGPLGIAVTGFWHGWKEAGSALEEFVPNALASLYGNNSKTTFVIGGETKGIFFGSRKTHITCGAG